MKKILSLFISFIMLFNLTAEVFAAPIQLVSKEEEKNLRSAVNAAYNNSSASTADLSVLERNYDNALKNLAEISDTYGDLEDAVNIAVQTEIVENENLGILNNAILKQKTDLEKYNKVLQSYEDKINKLGGMESIEKQYDLYQQWLALKPEMDQRKAELENIIKTGQDDSAVKAATEELDDYNKNYYSYESNLNKFKKDFDAVAEEEEYLQKEANRFEKLSELEESTRQKSEQAKQALLDLLPEDAGLSLQSDWDALFKVAQKEMDKLIPEIETAKGKFKRAEKAQSNAYQKYLEDKFNTEFAQTLIDYCTYVTTQAGPYQKPVINGKVNGRIDVAIEPGSVMRQSNGTWVAEVDKTVQFDQIKKEYLACINPSWDEDKLKSWGSSVTMEELSDVKYGEYLLKYAFEEGKKISNEEKEKIGKQLAKKTIGITVIDAQRGLDYFYTLYGDLNQSKHLANYLRKDWEKKGYGTLNPIWERNEFGDMEDTNTYSLQPKTEEGEILKQTYIYKLTNFENTRKIITQYFYELNLLMIDMMNFIAANAKNGTVNLEAYLANLGVSFSEDFLDIKDDLINKKLEEVNRSFTQEEKEDIVETKITKRPFDPLLFALGPSHLVDRNRTLVRERRTAMAGFDLNMQGWAYLEQKKDEPQPFMDLLFLNANLQTSYRLYKPNLEAWNTLAFKAYDANAMYFLSAMLSLGQKMNDKYEEMPQKYYEQIEESFHAIGKDIALDIGVGLILGAIKSFVSSTVKILTSNAVKVAFKSSFRQGVKAAAKRSATLVKISARKSVRNFNKAIKGLFRSTNIEDLRRVNPALNHSATTNIKAFREMKFKRNFGSFRYVNRGAQNNTLIQTVKDISSKYNEIAFKTPRTSKVFNANLTKQQVQTLSADLQKYYAAQKAMKVAKKNAKKAAREMLEKPTKNAANIATNKKIFLQDIKDFRRSLCGGHFNAAACTVVPIPQSLMDVIMGKATISEIFNRNPITSRIINKSVKRTLKEIEKKGLTPDEAIDYFFRDLKTRINNAPLPKGHKENLIEKFHSYSDIPLESEESLGTLFHVESLEPGKITFFYTNEAGNILDKTVLAEDFAEEFARASRDLTDIEKQTLKERSNLAREQLEKNQALNKNNPALENDGWISDKDPHATQTNPTADIDPAPSQDLAQSAYSTPEYKKYTELMERRKQAIKRRDRDIYNIEHNEGIKEEIKERRLKEIEEKLISQLEEIDTEATALYNQIHKQYDPLFGTKSIFSDPTEGGILKNHTILPSTAKKEYIEEGSKELVKESQILKENIQKNMTTGKGTFGDIFKRVKISKEGTELNITSEKALDEFIEKRSNGVFKNKEEYLQALKENSQDAINFRNNLQTYEIVLGKTPEYPFMYQYELRMPLDKFLANISESETFFTLNKKGLATRHTHKLANSFYKYMDLFQRGEILAKIDKGNGEHLIVFDMVESEGNRYYYVGIIKESESEGVNTLVTTYYVSPSRFADQFIGILVDQTPNLNTRYLIYRDLQISYLNDMHAVLPTQANKDCVQSFIKDFTTLSKKVEQGIAMVEHVAKDVYNDPSIFSFEQPWNPQRKLGVYKYEWRFTDMIPDIYRKRFKMVGVEYDPLAQFNPYDPFNLTELKWPLPAKSTPPAPAQ